MNKDTLLKGLIENGNPIRAKGENIDYFIIKNFVNNQIYRLWYASALKNIAMYEVLGSESTDLQEEFVKQLINFSDEAFSCSFNEYFSSLPLMKHKEHDYAITNFIIIAFNTCIECMDHNNSNWYAKSTLQDCIGDLLDGKIAVLNSPLSFEFLIYHSKEEQIYFIRYDTNQNSLRSCVLFDKRDIENNDFSCIINDPQFSNKDKKILTIYSSFEQYVGETESLRSSGDYPKINPPTSNILNTPDKINQNDLIDYSVNSKEKWKEFKNAGLLWFINTILHAFGYAIKYKVDKETGELLDIYPDRVKFRGFPEESNTKGYIKVSQYMKDHAEELLKEAEE